MEATQAKKADFSQVIGQFGVGFYSVFMVADWVRVTSRSYKPRAKAVSWYATGEDTFEVGAAEMTGRGTKVEIKLKEDAAEFAEETRLKAIIHKHSDYIGFPIYVGDGKEPENKQTSLWRKPKQEVTEDQYKDFYRQVTLDFEEPLMHIHMVTDVPVQLYALLFIPTKSERAIFSLRKQDGLKLYSRNILIDEYNKDLLPEYLRFMQGVVDSEDLPLNVSRETIQSTGLMAGLKKVLTNQVVKDLEALSGKEPDKYQEFWQEFGGYLKQGVAMVPAEADSLIPLLRFKTSLQPETWSSLEDYAGRMKPDQKGIYYIVGEDLKSVLRSPHLDYFQTQGTEVLLLTEPMDSFMLMGLHKYKDFELKNVAQTDLPEKPAEDKKAENIPAADFKTLVERFKQVLGERVVDVRASERLSQSLARLVDPQGAPDPELQRVYKYLGKEVEIPKKILELNPAHPILKNLLKDKTDSALQNLVIEQIFDSALLVEGLHPDPSSMAARIQQIMEAALGHAEPPASSAVLTPKDENPLPDSEVSSSSP
jgi:molecular chaperone HtpG